MKQTRMVVSSILIIVAFASLLMAFTLPLVEVAGLGSLSIYQYLATIETYKENKAVFASILLFVAAVALCFFCCIAAIINIGKGEEARGVLFVRIISFLALACSVASTVVLAIENSNIVGAGTIVPLACVFVLFAGSLIMPIGNKN